MAAILPRSQYDIWVTAFETYRCGCIRCHPIPWQTATLCEYVVITELAKCEMCQRLRLDSLTYIISSIIPIHAHARWNTRTTENAYMHNCFGGSWNHRCISYHPQTLKFVNEPTKYVEFQSKSRQSISHVYVLVPQKGRVGVWVGSPVHKTAAHVVTAAATKSKLNYSTCWRKCNLPGEMIYRV